MLVALQKLTGKDFGAVADGNVDANANKRTEILADVKITEEDVVQFVVDREKVAALGVPLADIETAADTILDKKAGWPAADVIKKMEKTVFSNTGKTPWPIWAESRW